MKKEMSLLMIAGLLSLFFVSCQKNSNDQTPEQTQIEFQFSPDLLKSGSEQGLTHVVVSIEDEHGNVAKNSEKVEIYNMNGNYISKPISLLVGDYKLTRFLVLNASNDVVYASPLEGSEKASLVANPLPLSFSAQKDEVVKLSPEVVNATESQPEDFGYVTFSFEIAETFDFLVGAFVYSDTTKNYELTDASISIYNDTALIYSGMLQAGFGNAYGAYDSLGVTNKITLPEKYDEFRIVISKYEYAPFDSTFTKEELRLYYRSEDKGPLVVILDDNFCMLPVNSASFEAYPQVQTWPDSTINIENLSISDVDSCVFEIEGKIITTSAPSFEYSFAAPGEYIIKLKVFKGGCIDTCTKEIEILPASNDSTVTDIDGNVYKMVKIGDQVWMAENLKVTRFNDGTAIPYVTDNTDWSNLTTPGFCFYDNDSISNKKNYGALYNYFVIREGKVCPTGWHIPSDLEWEKLSSFLDETNLGNQGFDLKSQNGWEDEGNGGDRYGFTGLPSGFRDGTGTFFGKGFSCVIWSSSPNELLPEIFGNHRWLSSSNDLLDKGSSSEIFGNSVRCIKD